MRPDRPVEEHQSAAGRRSGLNSVVSATALAVVVGVVWAVAYVFVLSTWPWTIPLWLTSTVLAAAVCLARRERNPGALAYAGGLLGSIPVAVLAAVVVFLATVR